MPTQVQIRRGTTAQNNAFTGAVGEVSADTQKHTLRVHDGSQVGGYELALADLSNATFGAGVATFLATPSSANLAASVTDETGSGALVFATSPTLVTPALGTPASGVMTNVTGTASGLTAGNVTTNANLTGHVTSVGNAAVLGSFTSSQLATALTDETGSGAAVFATSPTLVTPALGTPSSGVMTNVTGTAAGLTAGNVTTNANLTGVVTSIGNATAIADAALSIGKTSGLQAALDAKQASDAALTALAAGSDFVQFTGPTTTTKIFTLPDASSTLLVSGGALGTPSSGTATNLTGTASGLTAGNVTTNANLTGNVTSVGNATTIASGVVTSDMIVDGTIVNGDINASAAIVDTKLATISTAGKVSNSATTATSANTASAIVARDASGNFSAGTITASLTGNASTVTTNANLTGGVTSVGNVATVVTNANLTGHITSVGNAAVLGSFSSAQLSAALSDETGSGAAVFGTAPTFTTSIDGGATFTAFATPTTLTVGAAATTATIGYNSTAASTTNISTGATGSGNTKTINIGTGSAAGSTSNINLGSSNGGTVTINGNLTVSGTTTTVSSATLDVADKNITVAKGNTTDAGADGSGITVDATTAKTFQYDNTNTAFTSSENVNIASGKTYKIAGTQIAASNLSNGTTGSGSVVLATSPTLITPALGTPASGIMTNVTGTASGLTAGNVTTNANLTGHVTSVGNAAVLGSFTSAQLATALTDETGSGAAVFATSPTLVTPALGTPSALVGTNITGTASGLTAGNVTTNANLTGNVTSVGNATTIASGVVTSDMIVDGTIVNGDISASAAIVDTKLATISTAGKVSNSATTATNLNTASAIVARDASGNFSAGTITAALTGNASGTAATVTGAAQTAITSVGTLTSLAVSGAATVGTTLGVTGQTTLTGIVGVGTAPLASAAIYLRSSTMTGADQYGVISQPLASSAATSSMSAMRGDIRTAAAAFTMTNAYTFYANTPSLGASSAVTNEYGYFAANQGVAGVANAYGVYIAAQSGAATTNIGLYNAGTTTLIGAVTASSTLGVTGVLTATGGVVGNLTGNASTVTTNANLTGNVTSVGNATTIASGVVTSAMIVDGTIVNGDISASAAIVDTKLATISTASKVSNSATTATNLNTASAIVARDASGNFSAGTITAALSGNATTATGVNGTIGQLLTKDDRIIEPNSISNQYLQFGFTSFNNNNTSPYADYLHLRSYSDGSGGNDNLIVFNKSTIGMRIYQQSFGSATAYSSYADVWTSVNDGAGSGLDADLLDGYNSATTNTANTIVLRDGSGNFSAGTITAALTGNASTVTNATFYRQFTVRDDRSDGNDYSLAARPTGLYAITGTGTNGPGSSYLSLIHVANSTDVAFQIAGGYTSDNMYFRGTSALQSGTGYGTWRTVIHSGNIGSQTVSSAGTATALATARAINGTNFDGTAAITVTAAAGTLTGATLASGVTASSLTSVGTLVSGAVPASLVTAGTFGAGTHTFPGAIALNGNLGIDQSGVRSWTLGFAASSGNLTLNSGDSSGIFRVNLPMAALSTLGVTGAVTLSSTLAVTGAITASTLGLGANIGAGDASLDIGQGRTSNGYAFIDLVGDTTYTDYGFRIIRTNGGANATSQLYHRGTGAFEIITQEAASILLATNMTERMRITSSGNIGIGTASPTSTLHVVGTATISSTLGVTGVLTATGGVVGNLTGNASGTAATVTGAAQTAITSVGTLTGLTMGGTVSMADNVIGRPRFTDYAETYSTPAISSGTLTLNIENGNVFRVSLTAAISTLTISNPSGTGNACSFTLIFNADGTARAVTWPAAVKWPGGTAPTLTSTASRSDMFVFYTNNAGTTWYAMTAAQNFVTS